MKGGKYSGCPHSLEFSLLDTAECLRMPLTGGGKSEASRPKESQNVSSVASLWKVEDFGVGLYYVCVRVVQLCAPQLNLKYT